MHFGIFTYGSRGDVQPFIALSLGLLGQGHQVSLFAPENFKDFVESYGVPFSPLHGNVDEALHSPEGLRVLKTGNALSFLRFMQKATEKTQPLVNRDMLSGCEKVDVMITGSICHVWISCIAEKLNKRWGLISLSFPVTTTKKFPFAGLAFFNNPLYNRFSYRIVQTMFWRFNKKGINKFRQALSLPGLKTNIVDEINYKNILNLYAVSPSLIPRPQDWPGNSDVTGCFVLPPEKRRNHTVDRVPNGLAEWLQDKGKPVYIGLGSMPVPDPGLFNRMVNEILLTTDHRILFCRGWSLDADLPQHPNLFIIDHADHGWLLSQCKVAVIHGGAGTVAAVLRAKIPVIVASIFADQPWWGKMMEDRKLGVHIPFRKLKARSLLEAIEKTQTAEIQKNAIGIGERIKDENGVKWALESINNYFDCVSIPGQPPI
jgi:UDP:flavonoid glycosyltransferase YjiC (YdhE family)